MNLGLMKMVVGIIGAVIVICVLGMVYLVTQERQIPGTFETLVVSGFTGLLGLLVQSKNVP